MSEVFREIEEDLRLERYRALAVRYWRQAVAVAALVVGGIVGGMVLADIRDDRRESEGERYAAALAKLATGRPAEAALDFDELARDVKEGYEGYGVLARLSNGAALARSGDPEAGMVAYSGVYRNDDAPEHFRDLAHLQAAMLMLDDGAARHIRNRTRRLAEGDGPWRHIAREIDAHLAYRESDPERARALFRGLAEDPEAPPGVRARAREMLNLWADPEP